MPTGLNRGVLDLLIAADDRTGALEVAAAVADRGVAGPVLMVPWAALGADPVGAIGAIALQGPAAVVVIDLGSRHLDPAEAGARAAVVDALPARRHSHKIDSALRGNWAVELAARLRRHHRRSLVAAALPSVGRHVRDGEVRQWIDGRAVPVTEVMAEDPRRAPVSSRPADHLRAAGIDRVTDRVRVVAAAGAGRGDLDEWLTAHPAGAVGAVVADLEGPADLAALARSLTAHPDVLLAGTAEAVAASCIAEATADAPHVAPTGGTGMALLAPADHIVVVVGSRHERAHRQVERLRRRRDDGRVTVIAAPEPGPSGSVEVATADAVAAELAMAAHRAVTDVGAGRRVLRVVIGGDTAAVVLGDRPRVVLGTVAAGTARSVGLGAATDDAVTRAGSFGGDDALVELVDRLLAEDASER